MRALSEATTSTPPQIYPQTYVPPSESEVEHALQQAETDLKNEIDRLKNDLPNYDPYVDRVRLFNSDEI